MMKYYRKPKGAKQAIVNSARKGAIPPDAWDDYKVSFYAQIEKYLRNICVSQIPFTKFAAMMRKKFPRLNMAMIRHLYYLEKDFESRKPYYFFQSFRDIHERKKMKV